MNRIEEAFKEKAFIPFITCGDPSLKITEKLVYAMEEAGANLIELGIPFSDPTAEGVVIQQKSKIPLVFMTYANVVFSYGIEEFMKRCQELQVDGIILADVPFEEQKEFQEVGLRYQVHIISMIVPTTKERMKKL